MDTQILFKMLSNTSTSIRIKGTKLSIEFAGQIYLPLPVLGDWHDIKHLDVKGTLIDDCLQINSFDLEFYSFTLKVAYVAAGGDKFLFNKLADKYNLKLVWSTNVPGVFPLKIY